ncbi:MAG: hypothetical protein ICV54_31090 [Nostoc sp. C3-bin3]|nr:hypothetical protein [Nostoc sp. C3-bin3]
MKKILKRLFSLILVLILAWFWVIITPRPALAQINTINTKLQSDVVV